VGSIASMQLIVYMAKHFIW